MPGSMCCKDLHRRARKREHILTPGGTINVASVHVRQPTTGGDFLEGYVLGIITLLITPTQ